MLRGFEKIIEISLRDSMKLKNARLCILSEISRLRSVGWKRCSPVKMEVQSLEQFEHVMEGLIVKRMLWKIFVLGSVRKIGTMTSQNRRKTKAWKTNLKLKIDHRTGDDLEVMLHTAELCDNVPRPPLQETNAQPSPENERHTEGLEVMRQAMQRLFVAYNQCVQ